MLLSIRASSRVNVLVSASEIGEMFCEWVCGPYGRVPRLGAPTFDHHSYDNDSWLMLISYSPVAPGFKWVRR
jgi:hypothetical protein